MAVKLTIGMACYDNFQGLYFTVQALRLYHSLDQVEILIIDNKGEPKLKDWIGYWGRGKVRYVACTDVVGTTFPRQRVFDHALGEYVICIDSHVLLAPGSLDRLWEGPDLVHGPMYSDDFKTFTVQMRSEWRADMWGVWDDPKEEKDFPSKPFEIQMHGLGLFGCRRDSWLGFNEKFKGFGGEEGYIHEKFRRAGRRVMCLPWLKWCHLFGHYGNYKLDIKDRIHNYLCGFAELGMDEAPIIEHFGRRLVDYVKANG